MEWIRGAELGRGTFATVNLAIHRPTFPNPHHPPPTVVKSSDFSASESLQNESDILRRLDGRCRQIIRCFGDSRTTHNGRDVYNLFLEYASGGSLSDQLRRRPLKRFAELEVRRHASSILKGLRFIHDCGIVHCDVKLQNILLFDDGDVKISDFGLAKESGEGNGGVEFRGTPMYMAPEVVAGGRSEAAADVWAFGCAVVEMVTGRPPWRCAPGCGVGELLCRIGVGSETPEIPENLSKEGRDFVSKCLAKDPNERWTARMLLGHPFVSGLGVEEGKQMKTTSSPRGPFDFPGVSEMCCTASFSSEQPCLKSALNRVGRMAGDPVDWSDLDGWVAVR